MFTLKPPNPKNPQTPKTLKTLNPKPFGQQPDKGLPLLPPRLGPRLWCKKRRANVVAGLGGRDGWFQLALLFRMGDVDIFLGFPYFFNDFSKKSIVLGVWGRPVISRWDPGYPRKGLVAMANGQQITL